MAAKNRAASLTRLDRGDVTGSARLGDLIHAGGSSRMSGRSGGARAILTAPKAGGVDIIAALDVASA